MGSCLYVCGMTQALTCDILSNMGNMTHTMCDIESFIWHNNNVASGLLLLGECEFCLCEKRLIYV